MPVLGLLGILEAGRGISAPLSISGDWTLAFDPAAPCPSPPGSILQQIAFSVSQSGPEAVITLKDGYATALAATIHGRTLTAGSFTATISGERDERTLDGRVNYGGCAPVAFHAVRQAPGSRGP